MPGNDELFPGGEAPDKIALFQYLRSQGLDRNDAQAIVNRYHEPEQGGWGGSSDVEWTESQLETWLAAQPEIRGSGRDVRRPGDVTKGPLGELFTAAGVKTSHDPEVGGGGSTLFDKAGDMLLGRSTQAADEAVGRAQRTRDRFYKAGDIFFDSGPGMDPAALAQSLAVGVFTDAAGNPQVDPETGMPLEVTPQSLWQAIKGQTFDMGSLAMPRAGRKPRARAGFAGADDARIARINQIADERRSFITPSMAMAVLGNMDDDDVIKLQQQLWEAGLFGEVPPSWGVADETTRKAYMALFAEASLTPDDPIDRVLARLTDEAVSRGLNGGGTGEQPQTPAFKPEVASKESLSQMIDTMSQELLGRFATDEEKGKLIGSLQSKEIETQRAQYDRDVAEATGGGGSAGSAGGPGGGIDAFMNAIAGRESGGDYNAVNSSSGASGKFQIMPANWGPWAEQAGLGRNAPRTPENQERVAKHVMTQYYERFGNWRDVAIAWFAGPGAVGKAGAESRSDGNMTVRDYANDVMNRMGSSGGGAGAGAAAGQGFSPIETFDPQAEAQAALKAADPTGYEGHAFAGRAGDFFGLLQGLV